MKIPYNLAIFLVILLEGYVVLSSELLAIRLTLPFIGSGTDTVSIIIAAVLMPLAFGYQSGGRFKPYIRQNGKYFGIRDKLLLNIQTSSLFLLIGLSYFPLSILFFGLNEAGLTNRLALVTLYSAVFLVIPVYLLGQTIPLCSNYFSKEKLSKITGKILFFSTMGSFLGAVFSTLVLMSTIGVHNTVILNFAILLFLVSILKRKKQHERLIISVAILMAAYLLNSGKMMEAMNIVENNQYNTTLVYISEDGDRHLVMNNSDSSKFNDAREKHDYIEFLERTTIETIPEGLEPKNILVIGAGAFTFGVDDNHNHYDYLDMDPALLKIAEEQILKEKLGENKKFVNVEARAYLASSKKTYDLILLDAYFGDRTIPEYLVTKEFFEQVKKALNPGGVVVANFIVSPNYASRFSQKVDNTFRHVFPHLNRIAINEEYSIWSDDNAITANVIYLYKDHPGYVRDAIYTDDKNTIFFDKPQRR